MFHLLCLLELLEMLMCPSKRPFGFDHESLRYFGVKCLKVFVASSF